MTATDGPPLKITGEDISLTRNGDTLTARYTGRLVVSRSVAAYLREHFGELPHDVLVTEQPPPRWPTGQAWPPQVTVTGPACWQCMVRGR